jgi:hypothetical protein
MEQETWIQDTRYWIQKQIKMQKEKGLPLMRQAFLVSG